MDESDRSLLNVFNYPKFQVPNIAVLLMGVLMSLFVMGSFIVLQTRLLFALADNPEEIRIVQSMLWKYGFICGGALVLGVVLLSFWSLILTHRMVGPIPRVKDELKAMREKEEVHLFYLRDYDYLHEFFEGINSLMLRLLRSSEEYDLAESVSESIEGTDEEEQG